MLTEVVGELERGGAGWPADVARRLGSDWTEDQVLVVLADLFSGGVVGHDREVGVWWVA
ncbi:MAG: hypothetical protein WBP81_28380 [Solirubrobacteraceae bacterium]